MSMLRLKVVEKYRSRIENVENELRSLQNFVHDVNGRLPRQFTAHDGAEMQKSVADLLCKIRPYSVEGFEKVRVGRMADGGYVCVDDLSPVKTCFSCGVGGDDSFDLDLARRGVKVLQFDHTVDSAPSEHKNKEFFKRCVLSVPGDGITIGELVERHGGSDADLLLKIDIEHDEWPVFDALPENALPRFRQIVGEFHGFDRLQDAAQAARMNRVFDKLSRHFFVCHVHACNFGWVSMFGGISVPHVLELTFANRKVYQSIERKEIFPTPLDAPTNPDLADYKLGCFWF
jgi:hypothetical protein